MMAMDFGNALTEIKWLEWCKQATPPMQADTLVITGRQAERALCQAATLMLREIGPKFRLDERDRPGKSWLTNAEAMAYFGLSRATLARYRAGGTLPYSRVGQSVYYHIEDVEALLESNRVHKGEPAA